jgi:hypothetical protein
MKVEQSGVKHSAVQSLRWTRHSERKSFRSQPNQKSDNKKINKVLMVRLFFHVESTNQDSPYQHI